MAVGILDFRKFASCFSIIASVVRILLDLYDNCHSSGYLFSLQNAKDGNHSAKKLEAQEKKMSHNVKETCYVDPIANACTGRTFLLGLVL